MPRTLVQSDDFNRASLGSNWSNVNTSIAGDVQINSDIRIRGQYDLQTTDQKATAIWAGSGSFTDDHYSSIQVAGTLISGAGALRGVGVCVRASGTGSGRSYYEAWVDGGSPSTTYLTLWNSGSRTVLHSSTATSWAIGDYISLEAEGTTLRVCKNGTPLGGSFTATDSTLTTGTVGIVVCGNVIFGDAWEGGSLGAATTKKLKLLAHSSAASATSVAGVVFSAPTGGAITGTTRYGEFTSKTFEASLESGQAVLKVPVADFGGSALTTSDTPVALVRNSTNTTGIVSCTVIEE